MILENSQPDIIKPPTIKEPPEFVCWDQTHIAAYLCERRRGRFFCLPKVNLQMKGTLFCIIRLKVFVGARTWKCYDDDDDDDADADDDDDDAGFIVLNLKQTKTTGARWKFSWSMHRKHCAKYSPKSPSQNSELTETRSGIEILWISMSISPVQHRV